MLMGILHVFTAAMLELSVRAGSLDALPFASRMKCANEAGGKVYAFRR